MAPIWYGSLEWDAVQATERPRTPDATERSGFGFINTVRRIAFGFNAYLHIKAAITWRSRCAALIVGRAACDFRR
jgi:hypothetical protein